jgi:hypothetical protein
LLINLGGCLYLARVSLRSMGSGLFIRLWLFDT